MRYVLGDENGIVKMSACSNVADILVRAEMCSFCKEVIIWLFLQKARKLVPACIVVWLMCSSLDGDFEGVESNGPKSSGVCNQYFDAGVTYFLLKARAAIGAK